MCGKPGPRPYGVMDPEGHKSYPSSGAQEKLPIDMALDWRQGCSVFMPSAYPFEYVMRLLHFCCFLHGPHSQTLLYAGEPLKMPSLKHQVVTQWIQLGEQTMWTQSSSDDDSVQPVPHLQVFCGGTEKSKLFRRGAMPPYNGFCVLEMMQAMLGGNIHSLCGQSHLSLLLSIYSSRTHWKSYQTLCNKYLYTWLSYASVP